MKKKTLANASILTGVALAFMGRNQGSKSTKPTLTFLVGLTCVGKSHYLQSVANDNTVILSTDNIINDIAANEGITYDDFFETMGSTPKGRFVDQVLPVLNAQIEQATKNNVNVIVDMQNINVKSRALTYDNPKFANYIREAIVFDHDQLSSKNPLYLEAVKKACAIRGKEQNKTIPEHVIERSFNGYERPTSVEGFTRVLNYTSSNPIIRQVLSGVGSRSQYSPAKSTALSLLQDAPDESIEDLIRMVTESRVGLMDPVSRTLVNAQEVADALRHMSPKPFKAPGAITVYHATDENTARMLTNRGFIPQTKPRNLTNTYAPGRGIDRGLYVGATPGSVGGYGQVTLEIAIPREHLSVPTELSQLGETNPMTALKFHDGAVITRSIPAEAFRVLSGGVGSPATIVKLFPDAQEWKGVAYRKFENDFGLNFHYWVDLIKETDRIHKKNKDTKLLFKDVFTSEVPVYYTIPIQTVEVSRANVDRWADKNGYVLDGYELRRKRDIGGSVNQNQNIELVRIERKTAGFRPKHMMRAMSRGTVHNPNKVVGAYITIESSDPQLLKGREAREFVIAQGRKIGLVGKMPMLTAHVYPSRSKPQMWETRWELL